MIVSSDLALEVVQSAGLPPESSVQSAGFVMESSELAAESSGLPAESSEFVTESSELVGQSSELPALPDDLAQAYRAVEQEER